MEGTQARSSSMTNDLINIMFRSVGSSLRQVLMGHALVVTGLACFYGYYKFLGVYLWYKRNELHADYSRLRSSPKNIETMRDNHKSVFLQ